MKISTGNAGNAQKAAPQAAEAVVSDITANNRKFGANAIDITTDALPEDILEISADALQVASELNSSEELKAKDDTKALDDMQKKLDEMRGRYQALREGLRDAEAVGKGMADAMKEKIRCLQIAMRIMSGDKVPEEDRRYLAEKDIKLYNQAISLRIEKKDPKEYDSLLEDEEDAEDAQEGTEALDATDSSGSGSQPAETAPEDGAISPEAGVI